MNAQMYECVCMGMYVYMYMHIMHIYAFSHDQEVQDTGETCMNVYIHACIWKIWTTPILKGFSFSLCCAFVCERGRECVCVCVCACMYVCLSWCARVCTGAV